MKLRLLESVTAQLEKRDGHVIEFEISAGERRRNFLTTTAFSQKLVLGLELPSSSYADTSRSTISFSVQRCGPQLAEWGKSNTLGKRPAYKDLISL